MTSLCRTGCAVELSTRHSDANPLERAIIWKGQIQKDLHQRAQDEPACGSGNSVPSPFGGSPAVKEHLCEWAPGKASEGWLPGHMVASLLELSRGEQLTRGFGFSQKNNDGHPPKGRAQQSQAHWRSQTGGLSPIPSISCCKITGGDEFIFVTTPAISDTMSAQRAVSIGSRALQDSGPMCPNSTAQKELCFQAVGRIITEAMQVAPGKAGSMAAHVIFFKTQEPEADTIPQPLKRECILKQLHKKCESCLDPGEELSPRLCNPARSCLLCKLGWDHKDWQCLNTLHEPGQSSTSQKLPANSTLRMGHKKVYVTGPERYKGRFGILALTAPVDKDGLLSYLPLRITKRAWLPQRSPSQRSSNLQPHHLCSRTRASLLTEDQGDQHHSERWI